jgi:hypothetical protein
MAFLNWIATADLLSPAILTVREQALPPTDQGDLLWDLFMPRQDVPGVDLYDVYTLDYRPAADRREWNAPGRLIPMPTPSRRLVSIVPIEARDRIDEKEMQRISTAAGGNEAEIRRIIGADLPARVDRLRDSCFRRLEVDFAAAWANGSIVQRNPEDASKTYTASFGFSSSRYLTAGTAWDNVGVNAYQLLLAWVASAQDLVGPIKGAVMRQATFNAILADAPNLPNSVPMTRSMLADRVQQDLGQPFEFFINENSVDVFDDGGLTYTRTKVWPAQKVAAVPVSGVVGRTAFAPVVRAQELDAQVPEAGIDVRGATAYHTLANEGKELALSVQINSLPIPDENSMYITNVGV